MPFMGLEKVLSLFFLLVGIFSLKRILWSMYFDTENFLNFFTS